jgi:hypothetical protein
MYPPPHASCMRLACTHTTHTFIGVAYGSCIRTHELHTCTHTQLLVLHMTRVHTTLTHARPSTHKYVSLASDVHDWSMCICMWCKSFLIRNLAGCERFF